jgi:hypothetical protein
MLDTVSPVMLQILAEHVAEQFHAFNSVIGRVDALDYTTPELTARRAHAMTKVMSYGELGQAVRDKVNEGVFRR